jgi:hypothetical protein
MPKLNLLLQRLAANLLSSNIGKRLAARKFYRKNYENNIMELRWWFY